MRLLELDVHRADSLCTDRPDTVHQRTSRACLRRSIRPFRNVTIAVYHVVVANCPRHEPSTCGLSVYVPTIDFYMPGLPKGTTWYELYMLVVGSIEYLSGMSLHLATRTNTARRA